MAKMRKHLVLVEITVQHHKADVDQTAVWAARQLVYAGLAHIRRTDSIIDRAIVKATVKSYKRHKTYLKRKSEEANNNHDS